jgi:hypothetical protein
MTPAQRLLAAVRAADGGAPPSPPPRDAPARGSIALAKLSLAPAQPASAWLSPSPRAPRAALSPPRRVRLASGAVLVDALARTRFDARAFRADGADLPTSPAVLVGVVENDLAAPHRWGAAALAARAARDGEWAEWGVDGGPAFARETLAAARVTMPAYEAYARDDGGEDAVGSAAADAAPLYIFDDRFAARRDAAGGLFSDELPLPPCFSAQADAAAPAAAARPLPARWLLVSAPGSGTPVHNHPATVAALVLLAGAKLWLALPPDWPLVDEQLSAAAFFEARAAEAALPPGAVVIVQAPGETVFLPAGWYHCVLNVEMSTALSVSLYLARDAHLADDVP